jgi:hypothetical protein
MNATQEVMVDRLREAPQCVNVVFSAPVGTVTKEIIEALKKLQELQLEADKMIFTNWAKECPDGKPPITFDQWREEKRTKFLDKWAAHQLGDL